MVVSDNTPTSNLINNTAHRTKIVLNLRHRNHFVCMAAPLYVMLLLEVHHLHDIFDFVQNYDLLVLRREIPFDFMLQTIASHEVNLIRQHNISYHTS